MKSVFTNQPLTTFAGQAIVPLSNPSGPGHSDPCNNHFQARLLQLPLCWATLLTDPKTPAGSECGSMGIDSFIYANTPSACAMETAVAPNGVLDPVQGSDYGL